MACAEEIQEHDKTTMAPTFMSTDTLGHFLLPLGMNKGHIDAKRADYTITMRSHYLELRKDRAERHALRNLMGMVTFRLSRFEKALEYIDKILSQGEDPDNLNALANRKYICEKLFRFQEARYCKQRIDELVTCDETHESQDRCKRLRARSLAEQAFAYSFDHFKEMATVVQYRVSVELYEQALDLAGDLIDLEEKGDWQIIYAMACQRMYNHSKRNTMPPSEVKYWYQKAVETVMLIAQSSKDKQLLDNSWRLLGQLFQEPADLRPSVPDDMEKYSDNPGLCFKKALKAHPTDPRTFTRYAIYLHSTGKYDEAMTMANTSIDVERSTYNSNAYGVRAGFMVDEFKRQLKTYTNPNFNLLLKAEQDLMFILEIWPTPWHLRYMAEIKYYNGLDFSDGVRKKLGVDGQKSIQVALTYCAKAAEWQDGMKDPEVHKVRGDCLCVISEHEAALESFKRALECERPFPNSTKYGQRIVDEFAHVLKETESLTKNPSMLADMLYWLHGIAEDHISNNQTLQNLGKLKYFRSQWTAFAEYCKNNNSDGKLATIEKAADDTASENTETSFQTTSVVHSLQSFPGSGRDQLTITVEPEETEVEANIEIDLESQAPKHTGDKLSNLSQITGSSIPAAAAQKREETSVIQFIYEVNLVTGKTRHFFTKPPTPQTTGEVSAGSVRDAPERPLNRLNKTYDFFVIYSDSAAEWVQHRMLEELEGTGLKGCIKDREFDPAKLLHDNYTESIQDSDCIIVVITEDLERSQYDFRAMLKAIDIKNKLVIPVVRECRDLPMGLTDKPSLDARGAVDWGRLVRSIEQGIKLDATSDG